LPTIDLRLELRLLHGLSPLLQYLLGNGLSVCL